ncbi:hypothetical protein [Jannaschia seohaensis]|uniref:Uncharacterized protein n=1 Tax=Jannaschia seohaensis TaxID=475081 RepID=A0A2Y9AIN1_9RHOB|nr:hypothetical protein [Jannaschia seohaensis]PWJ20194.1 hypothetical protein BCF38_1039 [Jannaschia seohaensis]SSA44180.1 hypothetical protein SAMN05421539_1039 [Jannaschia seohaensis]
MLDVPPARRGLLGATAHRLDVSKPNQHDTKAEFLAEKVAVEAAAEHGRALFEILAGQFREGSDQRGVSERLSDFIDASENQGGLTRRPDTPVDLVLQNAKAVGFTFTLVLALYHVPGSSRAKARACKSGGDLLEPKAPAPNHYARAIALRLAKLIARHTGERPTLGTSSESNHPSTDCGRAVEDLFKVLGIKAQFRNAAKWAIDQLTDEDLAPEEPIGSLLGTRDNLGFSTGRPIQRFRLSKPC